MEFNKLKDILNDRMKVAYAVTFIVLGLFAYFLLVRVDIGNLYRGERHLKELNDNLNMLRAFAVYKDYINEFDTKFAVHEKGIEWLMEIVSESAKKKSVLLELVKPLEGASLFGYKKASVLVEGEAPYHEMAYFISDLENNEKYIFIEKFELDTRGKARLRRSYAKPERQEEIEPPLTEPSSSAEPLGAERNAVFSLVVSAFQAEENGRR